MITDELTHELREWAHGFNGPWKRNEEALLAIADRIDAALAERYIELPEDADGEIIHIGDRVENNERVARIVITDGSWEPSVYIEKLPNVLHEYFCNEISHYHKPTVEDVLREFADSMQGQNADFAALVITEYAAKLRLAGEE